MACPACGCKETYEYDDADDDICSSLCSSLERCAACGHVFDVHDHTPEDEDDSP